VPQLQLLSGVIPKARAFTSGPRDLAGAEAHSVRARSLAPPEKRLCSGWRDRTEETRVRNSNSGTKWRGHYLAAARLL